MQGPGSCYFSYWIDFVAILLGFRILGIYAILNVLQFEVESGFAEKTAEKTAVATGFKVRRISGDFNARIALIERYRNSTRISDIL